MTMIFNGTTGITFPDGQTQDVGVPDPGTNGNVLTSNGTAWVSSAPATTSPAGSNNYVQYNSSGSFGASVNFQYSSPTLFLLTPTTGTQNLLNLFMTGARAANNQFGIVWTDSAGETNAALWARQTGSNNAADILFGTNAGTGGAGGISSTTERMRITSTGNVGIGTNVPAQLLHIYSATAGTLFYLENSGTYTSTALGGEGPMKLRNINTTNGNMTTISNYDGNNNVNAQINFVNVNHGGVADIAFTTRNGGSYPEKMRIDYAGRITMPFQPAFDVYASGAVTQNQVWVGNNALVNIGSCYNTSTGVFTAPVAGTYKFSFNGLPQGTGDMGIRVNGTQRTTCRGSNTTAACNLIVTLAANDQVTAYINAGAQFYSDNNGWSTFTGQLIG